MRGFRQISILLSIIFGVFLGHNLVPHHHHTEKINVPVTAQCPVEHGDQQDDHEADHHPRHCHAFNDVVFDKYSPQQIQPRVRMVQSTIVPVPVATPAPAVNAGIPMYVCLKIPDPSSRYFGARSLRAPPACI